MKFFRKIFTPFALVLAVTMLITPLTAQAATFKDIPSSHWAYSYANQVSELGFMLGDFNGNFNPDNYIDKFDTSRVLARMAGYKNTGASQAELNYYETCYNNKKTYINLYANKFKLWNSGADKEIAYLLEKGILMEEDLNQFVIISNNQEKYRALNREEIAVFLVRLMGKVNEIPTNISSNLFKDDQTISSSARPYVYYLRNQGILSGDPNNNYNPKAAVTRAAMAVFVTNTYNKMNPQSSNNGNSNNTVPGNNTSTNPGTGNYASISGTISKVYPGLKAIQISSNDSYNDKILLTSATVSIRIDNTLKTFADLAENMVFTGVVSNNELISIVVTSSSGTTTPNPGTNQNINAEKLTIEGTVSSTKTESGLNYISVEIKMLTPKGEIITETRTYGLANGCAILRGDKSVAFTSIVKGDMVKLQYLGTTAYSIALEEKNRDMYGELVEKKYLEATNTPILVVMDKDNKLFEFKVNSGSKLTRKGSSASSWNELRVGDQVEISAEYDVIKTLYAVGSKTNKDLTVESLYVGRNEAYIMAKDSSGVVEKYPIITAAVDTYAIRVGSKVRARLDSREIEIITVLQEATSDYSMGTITNVTRTTITVRSDSGIYYSSKEYYYNDSTVVIDSSTGNRLTVSRLDTGMKVYVAAGNNNLATVITVLNY